MRKLIAALSTAALLGLSPRPALAAEELTAKQSGQVVDALIGDMDAYFNPDKAKAVQAALRAKRAELSRLHDRVALAEALSAITIAVSGDQHLKVSVATTSAKAVDLTAAEQDLVDRHLAYGLMAVRRLPGNVGYMKLRYFENTAPGVAMIDAAMGMLKDTTALIIDLRENTGGGGGADYRLLGHLSSTPLVLSELHWREADGSVRVEKPQASVPAGGPLYVDKPVFVLTGPRTFSAAEAVAYDIQANRRGLLIGTRTRGGANPSNRAAPPLGFGLTVVVPNGQAFQPLTGKTWDGAGLKPDVETPFEGALTEAYRRALAEGKPLVSTPKSDKERADAIADPAAALAADQKL